MMSEVLPNPIGWWVCTAARQTLILISPRLVGLSLDNYIRRVALIPTPPADQLRETLRLIDSGELPVPDRLALVATYAIANGCVDLETLSLTEQGRRVWTILGGAR